MRVYKGQQSHSFFARQVSFFESMRGLMFTRSSHIPFYFPLQIPLSIHSFFVFYPFFAVWVDGTKNIIRIDIVVPFTFHVSPPVGTKGLFEIPIHAKYASVGAFLVGKKRFNTLLSSKRTNI